MFAHIPFRKHNKREETCLWVEAYIVHLAEPFILGQIEGDQFAIKWLCELLNIDIFLWNTKLQKVDLRFHATNGSSKVVYLMRQEINRFHSHYQLLLETTSAQTLLLPINSIVEPASTAAIPHCKKHMKPIQKDTAFEENIVNNFCIEPKKNAKTTALHSQMATSLRSLKHNMRMQAMNRCQNQKEPCINKESLEGHQNEKQSCIGNKSLK